MSRDDYYPNLEDISYIKETTDERIDRLLTEWDLDDPQINAKELTDLDTQEDIQDHLN